MSQAFNEKNKFLLRNLIQIFGAADERVTKIDNVITLLSELSDRYAREEEKLLKEYQRERRNWTTMLKNFEMLDGSLEALEKFRANVQNL